MAFGNSRAKRIATLIQSELATILCTQGFDSALKLSTISRVSLSPDCRNAKIFLVEPGDGQRDALLAALDHNAYKIRKAMAENLKHLKYLPKIRFLIDEAHEKERQLNDLLNSIDVEPDA